jgi:hypothetical protein
MGEQQQIYRYTVPSPVIQYHFDALDLHVSFCTFMMVEPAAGSPIFSRFRICFAVSPVKIRQFHMINEPETGSSIFSRFRTCSAVSPVKKIPMMVSYRYRKEEIH